MWLPGTGIKVILRPKPSPTLRRDPRPPSGKTDTACRGRFCPSPSTGIHIRWGDTGKSDGGKGGKGGNGEESKTPPPDQVDRLRPGNIPVKDRVRPPSPKTRVKIRQRDENLCMECGVPTRKVGPIKGQKLPPNQSQINHKVPRAKGGNNDDSNLENNCRVCNGRQGDGYEPVG